MKRIIPVLGTSMLFAFAIGAQAEQSLTVSQMDMVTAGGDPVQQTMTEKEVYDQCGGSDQCTTWTDPKGEEYAEIPWHCDGDSCQGDGSVQFIVVKVISSEDEGSCNTCGGKQHHRHHGKGHHGKGKRHSGKHAWGGKMKIAPVAKCDDPKGGKFY